VIRPHQGQQVPGGQVSAQAVEGAAEQHVEAVGPPRRSVVSLRRRQAYGHSHDGAAPAEQLAVPQILCGMRPRHRLFGQQVAQQLALPTALQLVQQLLAVQQDPELLGCRAGRGQWRCPARAPTPPQRPAPAVRAG
jgi:hypothetical protein